MGEQKKQGSFGRNCKKVVTVGALVTVGGVLIYMNRQKLAEFFFELADKADRSNRGAGEAGMPKATFSVISPTELPQIPLETTGTVTKQITETVETVKEQVTGTAEAAKRSYSYQFPVSGGLVNLPANRNPSPKKIAQMTGKGIDFGPHQTWRDDFLKGPAQEVA